MLYLKIAVARGLYFAAHGLEGRCVNS